MATEPPHAKREYDSPFPECRVLSTTDPSAMLRLDMPRERAVRWVEDVQEAADLADEDELVTLGITMSEASYGRFANQLEQLAQVVQNNPGETASAQVLLDPSLGPGDDGVSVAVLLNREQLLQLVPAARARLAQSVGDMHRWEFSCSRAGAQVLVQQLIAACNGADEPLEEVDLEEVPDVE
jgi:hypothetical protein